MCKGLNMTTNFIYGAQFGDLNLKNFNDTDLDSLVPIMLLQSPNSLSRKVKFIHFLLPTLQKTYSTD